MFFRGLELIDEFCNRNFGQIAMRLFPISRIVKMLLNVVVIKCGFLLMSSLK